MWQFVARIAAAYSRSTAVSVDTGFVANRLAQIGFVLLLLISVVARTLVGRRTSSKETFFVAGRFATEGILWIWMVTVYAITFVGTDTETIHARSCAQFAVIFRHWTITWVTFADIRILAVRVHAFFVADRLADVVTSLWFRVAWVTATLPWRTAIPVLASLLADRLAGGRVGVESRKLEKQELLSPCFFVTWVYLESESNSRTRRNFLQFSLNENLTF